MGFINELKRLARPYEDEMEDDAFHEEDYDDPYVTFGQVEADFD